MHPVNLNLSSRGTTFSAINPLQQVSVSRRLDGGVTVGSAGLQLLPVGSNVEGEVAAGGQSVFFADAGLDEDVSVAPTIDGAEFSTVLRSEMSPEQIAYHVVLPRGATLAQQGGGAVVMRDGRTLAIIPAPSAVDAQDSFVPVMMRVLGDELLLNVAHRSRDVAYPLLVDPRVITYTVTRNTPGWELESCDPCNNNDVSAPKIAGPEGGVLTSPAGADYGYGEIAEWSPGEQDCNEKKKVKIGLIYCYSIYREPEYHPEASWRWHWQNSPNRLRNLKETSYLGVSLTPYAPTVDENGEEDKESGTDAQEDYLAGTGWWEYRVGCLSGTNSSEEAPPRTITGCKGNGDPYMALALREAPSEFVYWGPPGPYGEGGKFSTRVAAPSVTTTLSVEAVVITEEVGLHRRHGWRKSEQYGPLNEGEPNRHDPCYSDPVDCATGNLTETQTDLQVPGKGVGLSLTRTYNSQAAASQESPGPFGYGWSWTFGAHLANYGAEGGQRQIVEQGNGSTVAFTETEGKTTTEPGVQATLSSSTNGQWVYTLPNQNVLTFNSNGTLVSESDRNGNVTTIGESCPNGGGCRVEVTDSAGRKLTLYKNSQGMVERAVDPMGHTVTYGYENGNLVSVIEPGESTPRWRFRYDAQHRMTAMIDGRGEATVNEYDSANRVIKQTDPRGDTHRFEYREVGDEELEGALDVASETSGEEDFLPELTAEEEAILLGGEQEPYVPPEYVTQIIDEGTGAVTLEHFDSDNQLSTITDGFGTPNATTSSFTYDSQGNTASETNGADHTTDYSYDAEGNKTSETNPLGDKTEWKYDSHHDVIAQTTPRGETTTIRRDEHGNAVEVSRPAPGGETQITKYTYNSFGELTGMTDPLGQTWNYEYDGYGDRTAEIDPEGDKRTFAYNRDSQEISTTSPRGNAPGVEPAKYTTILERDAQGRIVRVIEPLE